MKTHGTNTTPMHARVEAITAGHSGKPIGYRLIGRRPGPQIVVAGSCALARELLERLASSQRRHWIGGNLIMIRLTDLDRLHEDGAGLPPLGHIDRTIILPWTSDDESPRAMRGSYRRVLVACASLGMISQRQGAVSMMQDRRLSGR